MYVMNVSPIVPPNPPMMSLSSPTIHELGWWPRLCHGNQSIYSWRSKEEAKEMHNKKTETTNPATSTIYTDGSGITNKIGAAIHNATINKAYHQHLGKDTKYNVFSAEVTALVMVAEKLQEDQNAICHIYTDSQVAIKAINNPRR